MPDIRIENLHFRYPSFDPNEQYPDQTWALDDVSIEISAGEFFGIIGTTGSGKTTLCLALNGLVPQQTSGTIRGDVWIDEVNTKRRPVIEIATTVGIVFQDPEANFLGLTVEDEVAFGLENLAMDRDEIRGRLDWALDLVGMSAFRLRSVAQLSGGQMQRVAIASVLAMTPQVLVLDDPTAELDPVGTAEVLDVIAAVRQRQPGTTVVMTSSDATPLAEGADRIAVLDRGKLLATGTPGEIFNDAAELLARGGPAPPMSELAMRLNRACGDGFHFYLVEQAATRLRAKLAR